MNSPLRLLIAGPLPPPKGGVSVHIARLLKLIEQAGYSVEVIDESPQRKAGVFNVRGLNVVRYLARFLRSDLVHVHSSVDLLRVTHAITAWTLRRPYLVTLHSWRPRGWLSRKLHRWVFRQARCVVCASEAIALEVETAHKVVRPAFIPPDVSQEQALPDSLSGWLAHQRDMNRRVIASNAYQLDEFEGQDIYGTDLCISMMHTLVYKKRLPVALIFNVASLGSGRQTYERYQRLIKDLQLEEYVLLTNETALSFVTLLDQTDLSVRATNTDGDALSIREALFLSRPVIASDVTSRPEGTRLFKSRDVTSLVASVEGVLGALSANRAAHAETTDDSEQFYQQLYTDAHRA